MKIKINTDDLNIEAEESLNRIVPVIAEELQSIAEHYERKCISQNRWIGALFLMLKDAGIEPSSKDIIDAMRRLNNEETKQMATGDTESTE